MLINAKPKKSLGQHFLINPNIPVAMGRLLDVRPEDNILEIGPGPGALTDVLATYGPRQLLLLEKDYYWAQSCAKKYPAQTILIDALNFDWPRLQGNWKIAGNLPYNVASPLIWDIVSKCSCWRKCVFMTQKEVALRLAAKPGSKIYGALSVWAQSFANVHLEFSVAAGSFRPPPKVESAVVSFEPRDSLPQKPKNLKRLLDLCFQKRRKQLGSIFKQQKLPNLEAGLLQLQIDPQLRPEALAPEQFQKLTAFL